MTTCDVDFNELTDEYTMFFSCNGISTLVTLDAEKSMMLAHEIIALHVDNLKVNGPRDD